MLRELQDIWARLKVHWHAVAIAAIAAAPILLNMIAGIDLTPVISAIIPEQYVPLVVALLPFILAVLKPMVILEDPKDA